jgi:SM-20-related protein
MQPVPPPRAPALPTVPQVLPAASALALRPGGFPGLDAALVRELGAGETLVFDGVLGAELARAVAGALTRDDAGLTPAAVGRGGERQLDPELRGDRTRWVERDENALCVPLWALFDRVGAELRERAWLGVRDVEVQLALYPGGGARYVAHRDAFAGGGRRRATAVYYLNEAWRPQDGGELRVRTPSGERDVEPVLDRLVLYLAEAVEHEVLPTRAPRWAATAWYLGPETPG